MELYCHACSSAVSDQIKFCPDCGSNLSLQRKIQGTWENLKPGTFDSSGDLLQQYETLQRELDRLEFVDAELVIQTRHYNKSMDEYHQQRTRVRNLQSYVDEQDLETIQNIGVDTIIAKLTDHNTQKIEQEEWEYLVATEKLLAARKILQDLKLHVQESNTQLDQLQKLKLHRERLIMELEKLLRQIGEAVSHPDEDRLENQFQQLNTEFQPLKQGMEKSQGSLSYLRAALQNFQNAHSYLETATNYVDFDTFLDGNFWVDATKPSNYELAKNEVRRGQYNLHHAYNLDPTLPRLREIHIGHGGEFLHAFYNNIYTDLDMGNRIEQTRYHIKRIIDNISQVIQSVRSQCEGREQRLDDLKLQISKTKDELFMLRTNIIGDFLEGT